MDIQEYILSGNLELYVLGQLSEDESRQVQELAIKYPEIQKEIESIEDSLYEYALQDAKPLDPSLKQKTFARIFEKDQAIEEPKVIAIQKDSGFSKYLIAASVSLFILIGGGIFFIWKKSETSQNNISAVTIPEKKGEEPIPNVDSNKIINDGNPVALQDSVKKDNTQDKVIASAPANKSEKNNLYIVHVDGPIINKQTGKAVKLGEQIHPEDQIEFKEKDAEAIVINQENKRFKIDIDKITSGNYIAMVEDVMDPLKGNSIQSTRGGEEEEIMDVTGYFGKDKFCVIGDRAYVKINKDNFPMSDLTYFMYSYSDNGKPVNKKIPFKGDTLLLDKKAIFPTNEAYEAAKVGEKATIYYQDLDLKSNTPITSFKLIFLPEQVIKNEFKIQIDLLVSNKMSRSDIKNELYKYIVQVYGKTDRLQLENWIEKKFPSLR